MAEATLPGVRVGPLDPEATKDFGNVAATRSAKRLVRLHNQSYPPALRKALGKPMNAARTKGLRLSEVREAVEVPDGHVVVGATVRGQEDDPEKVLVYTYRHTAPEKSRTVKWFTPLSEVADDLPASTEAGDQLAVIEERRELGLLAGGDTVLGDAQNKRLEQQLAEAREENAKLSRALQERDAQRSEAEGADAPGGHPPESDEPVAGYDEMNADEAAELLKGADQDTRDAIADYEARTKNRKTVMAAAESTEPAEE